MSIPSDPPISAPLNRLPEQNDNLQTSQARSGINGAKFDVNNDGPRRNCFTSMTSAISKAFTNFMAGLRSMSLPSFTRNDITLGPIQEVRQLGQDDLTGGTDLLAYDDTDRSSLGSDAVDQTDRDKPFKPQRGNKREPSIIAANEDYNALKKLHADMEAGERMPSILIDSDADSAKKRLNAEANKTPVELNVGRPPIPSVLQEVPTDNKVNKTTFGDTEAADILQSKAHKERKDDAPKTDGVTTDVLQSKAHKEGKEVAQRTESMTDILQSKAHKERTGDV